MELPICECATEWPGQGHHPECPVRREIERLRTALAAATERAEAAEKNHEMARNEIGQLEHFIGEAGRQVEAIEKERDAALARADALAARLAEVDGEHPA